MHEDAHRSENYPCSLFRWILLKLESIIQKTFLKISIDFVLLLYLNIFLVAPGLKESTAVLSSLTRVWGEKSQSMREIRHTFQMKMDKQFHVHHKELIIQTLSVLSAPSDAGTEHHPSLTSVADECCLTAHLRCGAMTQPLVHCIWRNCLTTGAHFMSIPFKMYFHNS